MGMEQVISGVDKQNDNVKSIAEEMWWKELQGGGDGMVGERKQHLGVLEWNG